MRKFLIMLMVVAMASFLMVGCLPGVTPDVDEDEEPAVAVTGVTLDEATLALTVGDAAVTLVATVAPATATETSVIWASSDKTVAIVVAGVVTPLNAGISAITVTTVDGGFVATCVVTVAEADEEEPALPVSTTPVIEKIANVGDGADDPGIINLYSSATQYMNKAQVKNGILVKGSAPKYSEVNVYVDDEVVGTGYSYGVGEGFIVFVAEDNLGADGAKTLYATATEVGLDESAHSTEYAFTLDTVAPKIVSVATSSEFSNDAVGAGDEATITVTCSEPIDKDSLVVDVPVTGAETGSNVNICWDISSLSPVVDSSDTNLDSESFEYEYDSAAPEVFELSAEFDGSPFDDNGDVDVSEGSFIRVSYEAGDPTISEDHVDLLGVELKDRVPITDLAGNKLADSVHYCYLEVAE